MGDAGGETTTCPFCAEQIQAAAIKCKHCGEFLTPGPQATATPPAPSAPPTLPAPAPAAAPAPEIATAPPGPTPAPSAGPVTAAVGTPQPRRTGPNPLVWLAAAAVLAVVIVAAAVLVRNHRASTQMTLETVPSATAAPAPIAPAPTTGPVTPATAAMSAARRAMFDWYTGGGSRIEDELQRAVRQLVLTDLAAVTTSCKTISQAVTDGRAYAAPPDAAAATPWKAALDLFAAAVPQCAAITSVPSQQELTAATTIQQASQKFGEAMKVMGAVLRQP